MSRSVSPTVPLTEESLRELAGNWYRALDEHVDLAALTPQLVPDGLEMVFPETTTYGIEGFAEWYRTVTAKFFDEEHTVLDVHVISLDGATAEITVLVNWKASKWDPPAPRSARLDFNAFQRWTLVAGPDGPQVARYVVERFEPNPGSADL